MTITEHTQLIQKEDGLLYYQEGEETVLASLTDIQKHYKTMQYNLDFCLGAWATDVPDKVKGLIGDELFNKMFWEIKYDQIPENCKRVK